MMDTSQNCFILMKKKTCVTLVLNPGLKKCIKSQFHFSNALGKKINANYSPSVSQCVELG